MSPTREERLSDLHERLCIGGAIDKGEVAFAVAEVERLEKALEVQKTRADLLQAALTKALAELESR